MGARMFLQLGPSNCGLLQKKKTPTMCLCLYSHLHATLGSALSSLFVCPLLLLCDLNRSTSQHPSPLTCTTLSSAFSSLFVRPQCFAL